MAAKTPTILLAPASFSLPETYDHLRDAVTSRGQDMVVMPLTTALARRQATDQEPDPSPLPSMYDDAAAIVRTAEKLCDEGKDVIIMAHSYSGTPLSEAAGSGLQALTKSARAARGNSAGAVVGLAFMTCLVPGVGQAAGDCVSLRDGDDAPAKMSVSETGWLYYADEDIPRLASRCFSLLPPEEALAWTNKMGRHSSRAFADRLSAPVDGSKGPWAQFPISYLVCERDMSIPPAAQRAGIERMREAGAEVKITCVQADHVPSLSTPEETVDWILGVAAGK